MIYSFVTRYPDEDKLSSRINEVEPPSQLNNQTLFYYTVSFAVTLFLIIYNWDLCKRGRESTSKFSSVNVISNVKEQFVGYFPSRLIVRFAYYTVHKYCGIHNVTTECIHNIMIMNVTIKLQLQKLPFFVFISVTHKLE